MPSRNATAGAPERAARLSERYADAFGHLLVTMHPDLPGEVKGKSSNLHWAARRVQDELIASGRLDARNLLITVCDADSRMDRQYLASLSVEVLSHPDGRLHIHRGHPLLCQLHALAVAAARGEQRLLAVLVGASGRDPPSGAAVDVLADMVGRPPRGVLGRRRRPRRLAHVLQGVAAPWQAGQDSAMYLPVYADAAEGINLWRSASAFTSRSGAGPGAVSDVPYLTLRTLQAQHIPWYLRFQRVGWYVEEHLVWPSHWFLLTLGGLVPPLINQVWAHSPIGVWQHAAYSTPLGLCLPSLILAILADVWLKWHSGEQPPRRAAGRPARLRVVAPTGLACVALPALDAHTRLLFGRPLGYQVTEKLPSTSSGTPFPRAIVP